MSENQPINLPEWDIEKTKPEAVDSLEEALSRILDPELGLNIIQLGLVRNIAIEDSHAVITMILTTPYCPYGPSIMESTRQAAEAVLGMQTRIQYGREAWDPTMMEDGLVDDWGLF